MSDRYGYTIKEIIEDGIDIAEQIDILGKEDGEAALLASVGRAATRFGEAFKRHAPDMVIVLGDRYELIPICQAAVVYGIPIAHISGGEITEGAMDNMFRNAVTQMSSLHFPGCEAYRQRIIRMGISPQNVFNYGDVGIENIKKTEFLPKDELFEQLGLCRDMPAASVTFHPATMERGSAKAQIDELLSALSEFHDIQFVITKANADVGGQEINDAIDLYVKESRNAHAFFSLGIRRYLSLLKYSEAVIGNSSSGIVEAPCFGIPTVNIGDRQKGRLLADSIINCTPTKETIVSAIKQACSPEFKEKAKRTVNPYGEGETSAMIVKEIKQYFAEEEQI